jgi:MarR family transcriptional regulator, organic hydroperoxide resistance regulator
MPPRSKTPVRLDPAEPDLKVLFSELVRLETELWNAVEDRLRTDHDLTLPRFEHMQVISRTPACRVHDIASALSITVGGTSKIVDRIEAAGHCVRRANPGDRRSSIIELTAVGERLLEQATVTFEDELGLRVGSALPGGSLAQLVTTLSRLRAATRAADVTERTA